MTIEEGLYDYLSTNVGVSAIVGTRVYPGTLPQNWTKPAISYQRVSGVRFRNLAGPAGRATPRIQIDCWAESYSGARTLAEAVRSAMDGYAGLMGTTTVGSVVLESDIDFYEPDTDIYRVSMDFWISHIET